MLLLGTALATCGVKPGLKGEEWKKVVVAESAGDGVVDMPITLNALPVMV